MKPAWFGIISILPLKIEKKFFTLFCDWITCAKRVLTYHHLAHPVPNRGIP
jgi:hypothetical protein